jgi:pilus assembly protein CpaC
MNTRPGSKLGLIAVLAFALLASPGLLSSRGWWPASSELRAAEPVATTESDSVSNFQPVPLEESRPFASPGESDMNLSTARQDDESVESFIRPLKGNDASIDVMLGQSRLLTLKKPLATEGRQAVVAIGDPTILDFDVLPNPQMIRLLGKRAGTTDLTLITTDNQTISFEVNVLYDIHVLRAQLTRIFPDAQIRVTQMRDHLILEGQARSAQQVVQIEQTTKLFISSMQAAKKNRNQMTPANAAGQPEPAGPDEGEEEGGADGEAGEGRAPEAVNELGARPETEVTFPEGQIINLIRVPGLQQVMLQVRVAELNRTALRQIGADWLYGGHKGSFGIRTNNLYSFKDEITAPTGLGDLLGQVSSNTNAFGIFPSVDLAVFLRALRQNNVLSILAEPNLVAMSGHEASFLAGGQFPVPVPQSGGGASNNVTIQFKDFGVQLRFVPTVIDEETIRLNVAPEVSTIDESLGTTLVVGGLPVPGINTRRVNTTVEMREGETLALAGLMQVEIDGSTNRVPGLGDLPYLGPFFSNTSHERVEKELLVLVTPHVVAASEVDCDDPYPGQELTDPNDLEVYLMNRIEGRTGEGYRSTTRWDDPWKDRRRNQLETHLLHGPVGFSR